MFLHVSVLASFLWPSTILSPADGHLVCFQFGVIMSRALMNIRVQVCALEFAFISLRWMPTR